MQSKSVYAVAPGDWHIRRYDPGSEWNLIADGYTICDSNGRKLINKQDIRDIVTGRKEIVLRIEAIP